MSSVSSTMCRPSLRLTVVNYAAPQQRSVIFFNIVLLNSHARSTAQAQPTINNSLHCYGTLYSVDSFLHIKQMKYYSANHVKSLKTKKSP